MECTAKEPETLLTGMNRFLAALDITFRRQELYFQAYLIDCLIEIQQTFALASINWILWKIKNRREGIDIIFYNFDCWFAFLVATTSFLIPMRRKKDLWITERLFTLLWWSSILFLSCTLPQSNPWISGQFWLIKWRIGCVLLIIWYQVKHIEMIPFEFNLKASLLPSSSSNY